MEDHTDQVSLVTIAHPLDLEQTVVLMEFYVVPKVEDPAGFDPSDLDELPMVGATVGPLVERAMNRTMTAYAKVLERDGWKVAQPLVAILSADSFPADNPQPPRESYDPEGYGF